MAITTKGIYYPDDYSAVADIPEDLETMAESIDTIITNIDTEQTTQNAQILALQQENESLKSTLPTTTGTGSNVTLDKTAEMEFVKPPLPRGNSEQVQYSGKNKFDKNGTSFNNSGGNISVLNTGVRITSTRNDSDTYGFRLFKVLDLTNYVGSTIRMRTNFLTSSNILMPEYRIGLCDINGENRIAEASSSISGTEISFTVPTLTSNSIYLAIWLYITDRSDLAVGDYVDFTNVIVTIDNSDMTYEPYVGGTASPNPSYPQPITNVTGDVEVLVQNANIWDEQWELGGINPTTGDITAGSSVIRSKNFIAVKPSTEYYFKNGTDKYWFFAYDKDKNYIGYAFGNTTSIANTVKTTLSNCYFLKFQCRSEYGTTYNNDICINISNTTLNGTYVPHQEQTFTFPLGTQRMYLGDYLADDGIHHVRKQVVIDGSRNWVDYSTQVEGFYKAYTTGLKTNSKFYQNALCSHFAVKSTSNYVSAIEQCIASNANATYISISNSIASNATELITWLSTHNVTVEYELATEEITPYTTEQQAAYDEIKQALSYEEQTNILGSSDESNPIFSVEAYQSIKLILAS